MFKEKVCFYRSQELTTRILRRVTTAQGKQGKQGKSQKKIPCMENSGNLKKFSKTQGKHREKFAARRGNKEKTRQI